MEKLKSLDDLRKMKESVKAKIDLREKCDNPEKLIQIRVAMATCGIASGAKEVMTFLMEELDKRNIDSVVTQTGCMSYCYAEPTIEVIKPGQDAVVFGYVDVAKANEIIEKYILGNELVEGIIPVNYNTMNE
jgi:NADP-reducing hydrogenase subunit HndB